MESLSDVRPSEHTARLPARAEVVGSLLRPQRLLDAANEVYDGHRLRPGALQGAEYRRFSDVAAAEIRDAVTRQIDCGLDVVSDGEFTRMHYSGSFHDAVEGFAVRPGMTFRNSAGTEIQMPDERIPGERLRRVGNPLVHEVEVLRRVTDHPFKVTLPAGSWFARPRMFANGVTERIYESYAELLEHALQIQREMIGEAIDAGARYIQLDLPAWMSLVDASVRERLQSAGHDLDQLLTRMLEADRRVIEGFPPEVRFALHLCRGNYQSAWIYEGSLEPIAEQVFASLPYDVVMIEWDDIAREGDYSPLRHVPVDGPIVTMGLVSSKTPELEDEDALIRQLEQAAGFLDISRLAISTQCGFASAAEGNALTEDDQWRKLELIGRVAQRVWDGAAR
ncbi:MAG TPA: hypothetical protein VME22_13470 [Solirubrobacteraceae bacterium]|nr:hypothetical protein [Solirubrobacteraceae bacterium]